LEKPPTVATQLKRIRTSGKGANKGQCSDV
jgi:hypothetical protein